MATPKMNKSGIDLRVVGAAVQYFENITCRSNGCPKACFSYGKALVMRLRELNHEVKDWKTLAEARAKYVEDRDKIIAQQRAQIQVLGEKLKQC